MLAKMKGYQQTATRAMGITPNSQSQALPGLVPIPPVEQSSLQKHITSWLQSMKLPMGINLTMLEKVPGFGDQLKELIYGDPVVTRGLVKQVHALLGDWLEEDKHGDHPTTTEEFVSSDVAG